MSKPCTTEERKSQARADQVFSLPSFLLDCDTELTDVKVSYQTWGTLNEEADNAFVVFHSLTGDANAKGWWPELIGPGCAVDTDRYFVICANLLGSCYGTTGPTSINPTTGEPWRADFPLVSVRDNVRLQRALVAHLGVKRVACVLGGSLGGMLALEWAVMDPTLGSVVAVATSGRHSAWCIAWSEAQRQAIYADPQWNDGYYAPDRPPAGGLAAARMMAMLSYRNPASFAQRFGREAPPVSSSTAEYSVQSYLHHQGSKLVDRFDANSYVRLSQTANSHDLSRDRGEYKDVLASIEQPVLVVGIDSDVLFPVEEQRELAEFIPNASLRVLSSTHGHDAFLLEGKALNQAVTSWLDARSGRNPNRNSGARSESKRPQKTSACISI